VIRFTDADGIEPKVDSGGINNLTFSFFWLSVFFSFLFIKEINSKGPYKIKKGNFFQDRVYALHTLVSALD
jgi:hypothetical protein